MADLEAVLADVTYLMAVESSKQAPASKSVRKIILPDNSVKHIMHRHFEKNGEVTFDKIFEQRIGYELFKDFCENECAEPVPQIEFCEEIRQYEFIEFDEDRIERAKIIYDTHILKELVSINHTYTNAAVEQIQDQIAFSNMTRVISAKLFEPYKDEIKASLRGHIFDLFLQSDKYVRFCQWKNMELNLQLTMEDFTIHRILGRGGFGEVFGARKSDTGKMFAMKCMDKRRIKAKGGETLAINERVMLSQASIDGCPFIVNMTFAFQTPDKLCFILDLMNGGDLHYHLTQHGVFSESEVRFYAAEVILGLEHMHNRNIVYRDLKPANVLLDEAGHVRISDLGLACDFSKRKPHACVGTHGYMAPEVLQKGAAYDSSADWFSFGAMVYKLLRGHSPFRPAKQVKEKEVKGETDKLTLNMSVDIPDSVSYSMGSFIRELLRKDPLERLGCRGRGADELREHDYMRGVDWQQVFLRRLTPPLVPPRGEVNAADAFDIGNFDEGDVKGVKLTESDHEIYKNFNVVISDRWQEEIVETVFTLVNEEHDKAEQRRREKFAEDLQTEKMAGTDCIVEGEVEKLGGPFLKAWEKRLLKLYPNRLEFYPKNKENVPMKDKAELILMTDVKEIHPEFQKINKTEKCIVILLKNDSKIALTSQDKISIDQWKEEIQNCYKISRDFIASMNKKVSRIYGTDALTRAEPSQSHSATTGSCRQSVESPQNSSEPTIENAITT